MLQKLYVFFRKETVLSIAVILALLSMFWVRPDKAYFTYIDFRTLGQLSEREDSIRKSMEEAVIYKLKDTLDLWNLSRSPYISVQQYLKGSVPGVYVQETTGEPGSMQNMLLQDVMIGLLH